MERGRRHDCLTVSPCDSLQDLPASWQQQEASEGCVWHAGVPVVDVRRHRVCKAAACCCQAGLLEQRRGIRQQSAPIGDWRLQRLKCVAVLWAVVGACMRRCCCAGVA